MYKIRVAICEDIKQVRDYFVGLINERSDMEVVCEAQSGAEIEKLVCEFKPDVVLMDVQMENERAGITATEHIVAKNPEISVIILTVHDDDELIYDSFVAGAVDYLMKDVEENDFYSAVVNAYKKTTSLNRKVSKSVMKEFVKMKKTQQSLMYMINVVCRLSPLEFETLKLLCEGCDRKEIARQRCVELVTVHTMVSRIMKKMGYKNSAKMIEDINALGIMQLMDKIKQ